MNKKILSLLIVLLITISGLVLIKQNSQQYAIDKTAVLTRMDEGEFKLFKIPTKNYSQKEYKQLIDVLNKVSKETGIPYVKREINSSCLVKNDKVDYSEPRTRIQFQVGPNNIKIDSYMSELSDNMDRVPKIHGVSFSIDSIEKTISSHDQEGDFYLETSSPKEYDRFINKSAELFSKYQDNITSSDFKPDKNYHVKDFLFQGYNTNLSNFLLIAFVFTILFIIIMILDNQKLIAICRLNGYSYFETMQKCIGKTLYLSIGCVVIELLIAACLGWKITNGTIYSLIFGLVIIMVSTLIVLVISAHSTKLSGKIKNNKVSNRYFFFLYIIKSVFIINIFVGLIPLILVLTNSYNVLSATDNDNKIDNEYAVFYPYYFAKNPTYHSKVESKELDDTMYQPLNKDGGVLFDPNSIDQHIEKNNQYLIVNPNYLKQFHLYDLSNKSINISDSTNILYVLIPEKNISITDQLINTVKSNEIQVSGKSAEIQSIVIKNDQKLTNLSNSETIENYPILVSTYNNSSWINRNFLNGGGDQDAMKIPLNGKSVRDKYKELLPLLKKNNYQDNYLQLVKLKDLQFEDLKMSIGNVMQASALILFSIFVTYFLTGYITGLYFMINKRSLLLKRIQGYSKVRAYRSIFILISVQAIILLLLTITRYQGNTPYFALTVIITIIECLTVWMSIRSLENKNIKEVINDG
ncbi:DUF1430 domain-containing protein [Companilactobacillus metriopterae]|uniref:DUF1430 domain-containing protein n=1 Tax=Companilactobacillus metriopterae TaxID=1909267 RepID=UPI00100B0DA5|nr:DUF1430 domain-containing protein [Companilactobacillus metriopterae]